MDSKHPIQGKENTPIIDEAILVCSADKFKTIDEIEYDLKRQSKKYSKEGYGLREKCMLTINYFLRNGFLLKFDPAYQGNGRGPARYILTAKGIDYKRGLFEGLMKIVDEMESMRRK